MVSDLQVRCLFRLVARGETQRIAALKSGMSERTARKYIKDWELPSDLKKPRSWQTRKDPFEAVWEEVTELLEVNAGLQAKTVFLWLQRKYPGKFKDGQLRTLQRKMKRWRALEGPGKEIFFPQNHTPGRQSQSDFTSLSSLGITIAGNPFQHLLYHFVLTYSNWEWGKVCFSESFESLSEGLQCALWRLGGVPEEHRTDRLSAALHNALSRDTFTASYNALLSHYNLKASATNANSPHENGDIEQRNRRFKEALDQALILRGSRDFKTREEYETFLEKLFIELDSGRQSRLEEELKVLRPLPVQKLPEYKQYQVRVGPSSTIRVLHNTYSVHSRLRGEWVQVKVYAEFLEVWYAQRSVETLPRLRGEYRYCINYRHIIDWLVRKPGAFENYRYRDSLFPTSYFRMTYDLLSERFPSKASKKYLQILQMAARHSEERVNDFLKECINAEMIPKVEKLREMLDCPENTSNTPKIEIQNIDLSIYDNLLTEEIRYDGKPKNSSCQWA